MRPQGFWYDGSMQVKTGKRLVLWAAAAIVLIAAGAVVWWLFPGLRPGTVEYAHTWPGRAREGFAVSRVTVAALSDGADRLLAQGGEWASWHRIAGKGGVPPAETSPFTSTADQVLRLRHAVESDDRGEASDLIDFLARERMDMEGRLLEADGLPVRNLIALDAVRALAEAYTAWGVRSWSDIAVRISGSLLDGGGRLGVPSDSNVALPGPTPTPVTLTTPTPGPGGTATPVPTTTAASERPLRPYCALAGLDVYTMQLMSKADAQWESARTAALEAIRTAYIGDALPLYLAGADPDTGLPVPYAGDEPVVDTLDSLLVILHLCEAGEQRAESIAWIRAALYNDGVLRSSYDIVTGEPHDTAENPAAYAVVARIARILDDSELYRLATERLAWHIADLRSSAAYGTVFRETADGRIEVRAYDNAWALLGMG